MNKYNNKQNIEQLKLNLLMKSQVHILTLVKKIIMKILSLNLIMLEYRNIKNIFAKGHTPKQSVVSFVTKNTVSWTYFNCDFNGEEIVGTFYEEELQITNQNEFRVKK